MEIGERIKELRVEKGITVNRLANIAGISQSYLRDIELGNKQPTVEYLSYICDALDVTMENFFSESSSGNELIDTIKKLSPQQQDALLLFLKTIEK